MFEGGNACRVNHCPANIEESTQEGTACMEQEIMEMGKLIKEFEEIKPCTVDDLTFQLNTIKRLRNRIGKLQQDLNK